MKHREDGSYMLLEPYEYSKIVKESNIMLMDSVWISDIYFNKENENAKSINIMETGEYTCFLQYYENKIAWLYLCHQDYLDLIPENTEESLIKSSSGLIGVFSNKSFKRKEYDDTWYEKVWTEVVEYENNPYFRLLDDIVKEQENKINAPLTAIKKLAVEKEYNKSIISKKVVTLSRPAFLDGESIIVASGDGDGEYPFKIGIHDGKGISLEFSFIN